MTSREAVAFLKKTPVELIALPTLNLLLAFIFWIGQIIRYQVSVQGVLYGWVILGVLFVFVQLSLFPGAWRGAESRPPEDRFGARWLLGGQIVFCAGVLVYSYLTLAALAEHHASFVLYDAIIGAAAATVAIPAVVIYRRNLAGPQAKLAYATAFKVAPQYVQAVALAIVGAGGVSVVSLSAFVSIVGLRYLISRATHRKGENQYTKATLTASTRDWWSAVVVAVCWSWGTFVVR